MKDMIRKARGSEGPRADRAPNRINIGGQMAPGVSISVRLVAPPSAPSDHVEALAHLQIAGFFYWLTYDGNRQAGGYWPGRFHLINCAGTTDWGNPVQAAFAQTVSSWSPRLVIDTAQGFFKAAIRRDPSVDCWGWAIEWNKNYRVIGFFGDESTIEANRARLPILESSSLSTSENGELRLRVERPLPQDDDVLFTMPPPDI